MTIYPLGRREPRDFKHVEKYPLSALPLSATPPVVNKTLTLPTWHWTHDQGVQGACVGFGASMMMSMLNRKRYDPHWLWNESKKIDEWTDTNPGDNNGTSVRAACDVLRDQGHARKWSGRTYPVDPAEGITENRWATTVDEMRAGIAAGIPITIGVNWYTNFDRPEDGGWIGRGDLGRVRGGHAVCLYGASDRLGAFRLKNSWGRDFPLAWLGYKTMERLLGESGEACLVTDR